MSRIQTVASHDRCRRLYAEFRNMFPSMENAVTHYGSIDYNTLRMTTTANTTLIFTYIDGKNWGLQTEQQYKECMSETR